MLCTERYIRTEHYVHNVMYGLLCTEHFIQKALYGLVCTEHYTLLKVIHGTFCMEC